MQITEETKMASDADKTSCVEGRESVAWKGGKALQKGLYLTCFAQMYLAREHVHNFAFSDSFNF